jgi:hypothetical protein
MSHVPQIDHDGDSEPSEPEDGPGSLAGAELAPPEPPPIREPVELAEVDPEEAIEILRPAIRAAARIVGGVDAYTFEQLGSELVRQIQSGASATGTNITKLCKAARTARSHLPDHYGRRWEMAADIAVRLITARAKRSVVYEEIYTAPAEIRRNHNGLGSHHNEQAARAMHFAGNALGISDRHCASWGLPLTTGTRDDRSTPGADLGRISVFDRELGRRVPGSLAEHVEDVLRFQHDVRQSIHDARDSLAGALAELGLAPSDFVSRGFAQQLLLGPMRWGPPTSRRQLSSRTANPGLDRAVVDVLERSGRPAVAFAGDVPGDDDPRRLLAALDARGYRLIRWNVGSVGETLGIPPAAPWGVQMLWSPNEATLLRRQAGAGAWTKAWRLVNVAEGDMPIAVALVERSLEDWPNSCLARAMAACAPGFLKSSNIASQAAWRALMRVADAALVDADRRMRARRAHG